MLLSNLILVYLDLLVEVLLFLHQFQLLLIEIVLSCLQLSVVQLLVKSILLILVLELLSLLG